MVDKVTNFEKSTRKIITYGMVIEALNNISKQTAENYAFFTTNLKDVENNKVSGFKFSSAEQGTKLGQLLENLGIKFIYHIPDIKSQAGELHIAPEHAAEAKKLFDNWQSTVIVTQKLTGNHELDSMWTRQVGIVR